MALARWTQTVQDQAGNAVEGCLIEVRREDTGQLVPVYSDREGTKLLGNPFMAPKATIAFHVQGGPYKITALKAGFQAIWRYVPIGTAAEMDADEVTSFVVQEVELAVPPAVASALDKAPLVKSSAYTVTTEDNRATVLCDATSGAFTLTLPAVEDAVDGFTVRIKKTDVSANIVTIDGDAAETIDGSATAALRLKGEAITLATDGTAWHIVERVDVVERGSNSNGRFVRFSNGRLLCYRELQLNNSAGNTWVSAPLDWPYPFTVLDTAMSYLDAPISNSVISTAVTASETNFVAYLCATGDIPSQPLKVMGEGTWF